MKTRLILDNCIMPALWDLIVSAKKHVKISTYKFELGKKSKHKKTNLILSAIKLKVKQNIPVKIILDRNQPNRGVSRFNVPAALTLNEAGADVRFLPGGRCAHGKMVVVDGERFYLGSHNLSVNAFNRNFEAGIIVSDSVQSGELDRFFDVMFATGCKF